eukprot:12129040-Alexandrium_andersonii.AAC.1
MRNPPIRNRRNPWVLAHEKPVNRRNGRERWGHSGSVEGHRSARQSGRITHAKATPTARSRRAGAHRPTGPQA